MKSDETFKTKLYGIITSLIMTVVLLIFSITTYCWISTNKKLGVSNATVKVDIGSGINMQDLLILKREGSDKATDVSNLGRITLSEYDTVFTDKNVNTPIIIRAQVTNAPQQNLGFDFTLKWTTGGNADSWKYFDVDNKYKMTAILSNIIGVRCIIGTEELNALSDYDAIYSKAIEYLNANAVERTFVTLPTAEQQTANPDNIGQKTEELLFSFKNYDKYMTAGVLTIFIELNYNDALIQAYIAQHGIEIGINHEQESTSDREIGADTVVFAGDLTNFLFRDNLA